MSWYITYETINGRTVAVRSSTGNVSMNLTSANNGGAGYVRRPDEIERGKLINLAWCSAKIQNPSGNCVPGRSRSIFPSDQFSP